MAKAQGARGAKGKTKTTGARARRRSLPARVPYPTPPSPRGLSEIHRLTLKVPPLTDAQRSAFSAQFLDTQCDAMGARTRSAAVLQDALAFAHVIEAALAKNRPALRRYGAARFAWFLECIGALESARAQQAQEKDAGAPARYALEHAVSRALEVRRELLHALELLAGEADPYRGELDAARGKTTKPGDVASSLNDLARLGDAWLRRSDAESKALVSAVDLQRGDIDLAWSAAQSLEQALARASGVRLSDGRDTPSVNRVEGRVLLEMRCAMRAFAHAHDNDALVPRLVPGAGTRNVLAAPRGKKPDANAGTRAPATAPPT